MYAFLDADGSVMMACKTAKDIEVVAATDGLDSVVVRIDNAPVGLRHTHLGTWYHRLASGDGSEIGDYEKFQVVGDHKAVCSSSIDAKTADLIAEGFVFDGVTFSLSGAAQLNHAADYMSRATLGPVVYNNIDDTVAYVIPDVPTLEAFYAAAVATIRGHRGTGTVLKDQVRAATTIEEIDAIEDTR